MNINTRPDPVRQLHDSFGSSTNANVPKYLALRDKILELIENGTWEAGAKLPTEADLAKQLPVSLGTIQKAYSILMNDGVIGRRRGLGSFVQQRDQMAGPMHCRFAGDDGEVLPIYPLVRSLLRFSAKEPLAKAFGGQQDLLRIEREISVNKEFILWNRFYIPVEKAQPLLDFPKEKLGPGNFKTILGVEPRSVVERIEQRTWPGVPELHTSAEPEVVEATAFTIEARAIGRDGRTIYLLEILIPQTNRPLISTISFF